MIEMTNNIRADRARAALEAYQAIGGNDGETVTDIGDLICNLLHLAHEQGLEPRAMQRLVNNQVLHFEAELEEEGTIP